MIAPREKQLGLDVALHDFRRQIEVEKIRFEAFQDLRFLEYGGKLGEILVLMVFFKLAVVVAELAED